ncbi:hypothetical protein H6P81_002576 [Aristolochia fimbriata]|uniref:Pentatricopeptide repeat-containing protein n=1 Tax=Aristolochia fimbriata TaxID=158543 RepID=A0AAV7FAU6_ARIFI|nr:hypothetical protein H6P81_002576 [Aristolochia fimbriata]
MVSGYAKQGFVKNGLLLVDEMRSMGMKPDLVTWNALIAGFSLEGEDKMAINLFQAMKDDGICPDVVSWTSIISGSVKNLHHAGWVEVGEKIFNMMQLRYGIQPRLEHYACMVDLLGRAGRISVAYEFIKTMPVEPDAFVWGALLGACRHHGNIELAELSASHLFELEPKSVGSHAVLSSMLMNSAVFLPAITLLCSFTSDRLHLSRPAKKKKGVTSIYIEKEEKKKETGKMTITPAVRITERKLVIKDRTILTGVPDNIITTSGASSSPVDGIFMGAAFEETNSRHVVSLGTLRGVRFLSCFRFKMWWMAQRMGDRGRDVPLETQLLLVESKDGSHSEIDEESSQILYTVFLPLVEGPFRACLQGNSQDEVELCIESGDSETKLSAFSHTLFVSAGTDPFAAITEAIFAVKSHLKTFRQRSEKKLPGTLGLFRLVHVGRLLPRGDPGRRGGRTGEFDRWRSAAQVRDHRRRMAICGFRSGS